MRVVEDDVPEPGPGEVRVRVLAAGVSFTDAQIRAGTYLGGPKPPFTPGYELVGDIEELGPGCSRLRVGDGVGALTVWWWPVRGAPRARDAREHGGQGKARARASSRRGRSLMATGVDPGWSRLLCPLELGGRRGRATCPLPSTG
jgi:NADPH:quinone reductase-like Zn-dependent oxidoreductase